MKKDLIETLQGVSLGLFVNGSYGLMHNQIDLANMYITVGSVVAMYIFIHIKRRHDD